jgi:hypothetical protein
MLAPLCAWLIESRLLVGDALAIQYNARLPSSYNINSFPVMAPILAYFFFTGVYLPQKSDLAPTLERQYNSVQKQVPSYQVEISPGCFVCGQWTALTCMYLHNYGRAAVWIFHERCSNSNPARVKAREEVQKVWWRAGGILFKYLEYALTAALGVILCMYVMLFDYLFTEKKVDGSKYIHNIFN